MLSSVERRKWLRNKQAKKLYWSVILGLVPQYLRLLALEITAAFHAAKAQHWTNIKINLVLECLVFLQLIRKHVKNGCQLYPNTEGADHFKVKKKNQICEFYFEISCIRAGLQKKMFWKPCLNHSRKHTLQLDASLIAQSFFVSVLVHCLSKVHCIQITNTMSPTKNYSLVGIAPSGAVIFLLVNYTLVLRQIKKLF